MARPIICLREASFQVMSKIKISLMEKKLIPSPPLRENTHVLIRSPSVFSRLLNSATDWTRVFFVLEENSIYDMLNAEKYKSNILIPDWLTNGSKTKHLPGDAKIRKHTSVNLQLRSLSSFKKDMSSAEDVP
nr:C13 protein - rabbit fibroma virus [Rabbit fibroma virus]